MRKIGLCLMIGLKGETLSVEEKKFIEKEEIGAILLFQRNCRSYKGAQELCRQLYSLKTSSPLIIAIDREGGVVDRFKAIPEFVRWPSADQLFQKCSLEEIKHIQFLLHQELKHIGVNMNLSPCLDLFREDSSVLKSRTFSKNPISVGQAGGACIEGARQAQVLSCAKHFPGHGGVSEDSHLEMPIQSCPQIKESLLPFRMAQAHHVQSMMLSHILYSAFDSIFPASMSSTIIQQILKKNLGFSGLILTDDINMKAVSGYAPSVFAEKALKAGANMLICGEGCVDSILKLSQKKDIQSIIEKRVQEVLHFKKKYLYYLTPKFPSLPSHRQDYLQNLFAEKG